MSPSELPHAYPFVLVDRVLALEPGVGARTRRRITSTDPLLSSEGCLPSTLLLEAIAQCAGIAIAAASEATGGVLVGFDRFRISGTVNTGDSLEVSARVVRRFGAMVKARGKVRANGRLRAAAEVVLQVK